MTESAAQIQSNAFATVANNALAHFPANSLIKAARVRLLSDRLEIMATDSYTAGRDWTPLYEPLIGPERVFEVDRETLQQWDTLGRKDKKGVGRLVVTDDGVVFHPQDLEETWAFPFPPDGLGVPSGAWDGIESILADVMDSDVKTCFQPQLLQRFSKVKADKTDRVADLAIADPERPVLVKIGPTFTGLIMPVKRERHAEAMGDEEGLW